MRRITAIVLAGVILVALPSLALAQEPAKYTFASAQGDKHLKVTPGGEGMGVIYFYNVDGNRITHISLEVSQSPNNWQVEIQPPLGEIQVEVGGSIVTVTENLHVEPSEVLPEEVEDVPEGMVCIPVPSRGYALAKAANVLILVPDSEEIGTNAEINVSAEAEWLGQTGSAAIKQSRDFKFSVEVISEITDFEERIIEENDDTKSGESSSTMWVWLPAIIATVIVLAVLTPRLARRRRE